MRNLGFPLGTCCLLLLTAMQAVAQAQSPEVDGEGLHLVHNSELKLVYARPGVNFSAYRRIILVDPQVTFSKDWERDHSGTGVFSLTPSEISDIRERVGEGFTKVFGEELEKNGFEIVDQVPVADDLLVVRPSIVDLYVEAPDPVQAAGSSRVVATSAGSMTLYAELIEPASRQLIGRIIDPQADQTVAGGAVLMTRGTNKIAEDRIVRGWADGLARQLKEMVGN